MIAFFRKSLPLLIVLIIAVTFNFYLNEKTKNSLKVKKYTATFECKGFGGETCHRKIEFSKVKPERIISVKLFALISDTDEKDNWELMENSCFRLAFRPDSIFFITDPGIDGAFCSALFFASKIKLVIFYQ